MSRPFYFITCQWTSSQGKPVVDPDDLTTTVSSLRKAKRLRKEFQKQSDEDSRDDGHKELYRIFKVKEIL
jgi:hypothetical protein